MSRHKVLTSKHQHFDTAQYLSFSSAIQKMSLHLLPPQPSPRLGSLPLAQGAWGENLHQPVLIIFELSDSLVLVHGLGK